MRSVRPINHRNQPHPKAESRWLLCQRKEQTNKNNTDMNEIATIKKSNYM